MGPRAGPQRKKSHHFNTFRSGIFFGLALPALVSGIYQSAFRFRLLIRVVCHAISLFVQTGYQPNTRAEIPGWDALLFLYSILVIPVLFSVLVGLNILVWSQSKIDYVSIFGAWTFHFCIQLSFSCRNIDWCWIRQNWIYKPYLIIANTSRWVSPPYYEGPQIECVCT